MPKKLSLAALFALVAIVLSMLMTPELAAQPRRPPPNRPDPCDVVHAACMSACSRVSGRQYAGCACRCNVQEARCHRKLAWECPAE